MPQCWAQLMMMTITVAATMMSLISRVSGQQQDFNVLFINEQNNTVAKAAFDAAVTFIKSRGSAVARARTGKITEIVNVKKNSYDFVNTTCQQIDSLVNAGTPPHLIVDTTLSGVSSEIVKAVAKALQIPTMSASYGHDNDITEWRDVSVNQEKYLVQIMPPGDIMTDVIRNIVSSQNITSAAVLYKSLLVNLPVRHIISAMDKTEAGLRNQTARIRDADVSTFFLVGSKDSITRALSVATAENMFGKKYAWFALTKDTAGLSCASCRNATLVYMRPTPTAAEFAGKVQQLGQANGLTATPTIDAAFYFDIILTAFRAVTKLVDDGSFKNYTVTTCAAYDKNAQPLDRMTIDLRAAAKAMTSNPATDLTYGRFVWDRNGKSFQELKLTLDKFKFSSGAAMASDGERLGVWLSGLLSGVMTMEPGKNLSEFQAISVYRVTTVITPPFMMKRVHPNGTVEYYGYCVDLINAIRNIVVFDYELYEAPDGKFGSMSDSSEWSGMIKELIDKKADIALAPLSVMAERENVVDFTVPYYDLVGITILMKKSKATTSLFKFLTVLETDVWFCILAAYFFTRYNARLYLLLLLLLSLYLYCVKMSFHQFPALDL
ncbi:unnamed protein product [Notodromas monacha]|uniref:Uncharacterized protein n=1 Tax=Notodromas monacha TaxID=399045 RepID=A0A7R9BY89_9CRUS|nr:unnamed protein product [Notodromas monacha]CAG0922471.1 unnamed protein product [Notodromas monacha]